MALCVRFCTSRIRRYPLVAAALGQCRGFHHCFGAVCTGCWCWPGSAHHPGTRPSPGGIAVRCLEFLMVSIWCFFHPTHQSCSPASASGRSPTRPSPIATSRRWMSCKRCKYNAVSPESPIRSVSIISLSSIGGLPCPHKRDLSGSKPLFPQTLLFVPLAHLRDISLRS